MPQLAYSIDEATRALSISRAQVYRLIDSGELNKVKIGRAVRIPAADVHRLAGHTEPAETDADGFAVDQATADRVWALVAADLRRQWRHAEAVRDAS